MTDKNRWKRKHTFRWYYLIPCLVFLVGFCIFMYPYLTNWKYRGEVVQQREKFELSLQENENVLLEELYQRLTKENESLYLEKQDKLTDPWAYEQAGIELSEYGLKDNTIGFLRIDKMEIELPLLLGANKENMKLGAVHLTETSYPIGGNNTNCVIAAHRGYYEADMFRHIEKLELGDEVVIANFREELIYEVSEIRIIAPHDVEELLIQEGRDLITLLTCHPYTKNYQRYVVFCERKK